MGGGGRNPTQTCKTKVSEKHPCHDWNGQFSRTCTGAIGVALPIQAYSSLVLSLSDTISWKWFSFYFQKVFPNFFTDRNELLVFGTPYIH